MAYQVRVKPKAEKELKKIPNPYNQKILIAITLLAGNPFIGKKLEGEYNNHYCFRVWPYRIIYKVFKDELLIIVIRIGHRQGVYK
ncbi:MAG: type II toxin-antitoxin system RelE/ParE family toxin [bacterium]